MNTAVYKALCVPVVLLLASLCGVAQSVMPFPGEKASSVAVVVRDLSSGETLVSQNPDKAMLPASTVKCLTSAASLIAGTDTMRIITDVYLRGKVENGALKGDLVVRGAGDPTTDSRHFPEIPGFVNEIAQAVKDRGITTIEGCIIVDTSFFPDNGPCDRWELSDTRYDYGAGLWSVNYRDNSAGSRAMSAPEEEFGEALENRLNALGVNVQWNSPDITAEIPQSEDIDNQERAQSEPEPPLTLLVSHKSPLGRDILSSMMCRSDNLFAEGMLRRLAPGSKREAAIARERTLLTGRGVNLDVADIYDGSGLARNNRLTANVLADVLTMMARSEKSQLYCSLFPRVGEEGTVRNLLKGTSLEGMLGLKSGSMNGVHCYAGYKFGDDGKPTHAVVIFVNDFFCSRSLVRSAIASFLKNQFGAEEEKDSTDDAPEEISPEDAPDKDSEEPVQLSSETE